ncbi:hypothetical protein [Marivita sp.]|uniref:hypothetical protein n=1 Tax=Marivita sp. TaxID=2003365 RepID=UPI003A89D784
MIDDQMIGAMSITFAAVRFVGLANATLQARNHRNQHRQTIGCKKCVFLKHDTRRTRKRIVLQIVTALKQQRTTQ